MRVVLAVAALAVAASAGTAASAMAAAVPGAFAFGFNASGELGDGTRAGQTLPVPVSGLPGTVRQLSVGGVASAALLADGTVWTWGGQYVRRAGQRHVRRQRHHAAAGGRAVRDHPDRGGL